ncbi:MAG: DEAD/DEAH box helicase, partial [Gemmatimonadales bacterium]|nr:DEAD/DEAH box helicase [Gemmatimonadales bacterium]
RSLLPEEDPAPAPAWLLPEQIRSFRRSVSTLRRYGGAVLADPVGSGKTYVALGVALALNSGRVTACLVPAPLVPQWRAVATRLGVKVVVGSHQQTSRGRLPEGTRGLVLIDESHHYRNPRSLRYGHLAPWLAGRPTLLITATPIVNRLDDLVHQLLLGVRDDALLAEGVVSLRSLFAAGRGAPALGHLVIENRGSARARPERLGRTSVPEAMECEALVKSLDLIERLRLSRLPPVAALVRAVLRRAAGSSPAALLGALRRYRTLLLHSRDAVRAGCPLARAEVRRFTGELEDQLVWWELLAGQGRAVELELSDLEVMDSVLEQAAQAVEAPDGKLARLRRILADRQPTLVFTAQRETVRHLRNQLDGPAVAWCTGRQAGLGRSVVPRSVVLGWFRGGAEAAVAERLGIVNLVVTDVAAEGLDLQRAARVVHYDLPWTPMRLEQREGRAIRLGSLHRKVEVVRFAPPAALERALRMESALARKARLPQIVGLGAAGRRLWRWRSQLGDTFGKGDAIAGVALIPQAPDGVLAGFSMHAESGGCDLRPARVVLWLAADGSCTEEEEVVAARLAVAAAQREPSPQDADRLREALVLLAQQVRLRLTLVRGRWWATAESAPGAHRVAARLQEAIRLAARQRDLEALGRLERALAFVGGGHTAGETLLLERVADTTEAELLRAAARFPPPSRRWGTVEIRLCGVLLFGRRYL